VLQVSGRRRQLLFDLDGTLTDSRPGIVRCIQHALTEVGVSSPGSDTLTKYVGPPLPRSFAALLGTSDPKRIELAIASYRRRFEEVGMFENRLYPGIDAVLAELAGAGHRLHLVTAKPRVYAARILEHFKLSGCFRGVFGPELGERDYSKETLIHQACASGEVACDDATMIGDRAEDIVGAKRNGLRAVAVLWGYGEPGELEAAEPHRLVSTTEELVEYVRR